MGNDTHITEYVRGKVSDILKEEGIDLVEFKMFRQGPRWVVRAVVDYPSGGIDIEKCAYLNRRISDILEKDEYFPDSFVMEVNSPGIDRPLRSPGDFSRIKGGTVGVWLKAPFKEKEYIEGNLIDVDDENIVVRVKEEDWRIPFGLIKTAKQKVRI